MKPRAGKGTQHAGVNILQSQRERHDALIAGAERWETRNRGGWASLEALIDMKSNSESHQRKIELQQPINERAKAQRKTLTKRWKPTHRILDSRPTQRTGLVKIGNWSPHNGYSLEVIECQQPSDTELIATIDRESRLSRSAQLSLSEVRTIYNTSTRTYFSCGKSTQEFADRSR